MRGYTRKWADKNREKVLSYSREYDKTRRVRDPERTKELRSNRREEIKAEVIAGYGGKCACCGETEIRFLSLDHVDGNGYLHRKELRNYNPYRWALKHRFPTILQVMCHNCNQAKRNTPGSKCPVHA
jgi:hypothetical protein